MHQGEDVADSLVAVDRDFFRGCQSPPSGLFGKFVHSLRSLGSNSILRMARAAAAEKSRRSGRISRERIASSLSAVLVRVAIENPLRGSYGMVIHLIRTAGCLKARSSVDTHLEPAYRLELMIL